MDNKTSPKPVKLAEDTITQGELIALSDWMLSGKKLTKAEETLAFELEFSSWVGSQYAIFTNSGSSSNLLMIFALKELGLLRNNKAIAASVSWVTTVSPLLQFGFETVLCDCDPKNLGLDLNHLEHLCKTERPSVLILVHVLGHANKMKEILEICERYGVYVLEDACEALGSSYSGKKLFFHALKIKLAATIPATIGIPCCLTVATTFSTSSTILSGSTLINFCWWRAICC